MTSLAGVAKCRQDIENVSNGYDAIEINVSWTIVGRDTFLSAGVPNRACATSGLIAAHLRRAARLSIGCSAVVAEPPQCGQCIIDIDNAIEVEVARAGNQVGSAQAHRGIPMGAFATGRLATGLSVVANAIGVCICTAIAAADAQGVIVQA